MPLCAQQKLDQFARGDTVILPRTMVDEFNVPVDITASEITFTMKVNTFDPDQDAVIQKFGVIIDPLLGTYQIRLSPGDTDVEPGVYYYDIQWEDSLGNVVTVELGRVTVRADITRNTTSPATNGGIAADRIVGTPRVIADDTRFTVPSNYTYIIDDLTLGNNSQLVLEPGARVYTLPVQTP